MMLSLLFSCVAYLAGIGTPHIFAHTQTADAPSRTLTFRERVAYQYAIEDVYWRHRIWPKDNLGPKPTLDAFVSREQIEKKVQDYLRKSQQVVDQRGWPLTVRELQTEMERMAQGTKQPEELREFFAALGNDALVIAECLARPILAERLANELRVRTNGRDSSLSRPLSSANDAAHSTIPSYQTAYKLPEISPLDCADDTWTATSIANAPVARNGHTAVWTGSEMIIWGGGNFSAPELNTGARYDPATDSWTTTSTINAPSARSVHSAVWTGSEMIVWGGYDGSNELSTGGRYNPVTESWVATSAANAPVARDHHTALWTGSQMIIWGGYGCGANCILNSGGRYNPAMDSWTATSTINAPEARWEDTVEWTGSEMIIWGGTDGINYQHTGGRYNPATDSWTPTGLINAPLGRIAHTAVWTGNEMIVWGGVDETFDDCNTGGRYNPINDSWVATSLSNAPSPRDSHTAVWTGSEMIIWAGIFHTTNLNTGGRYNPSTDSWTATSVVNAPSARYDHTAVWTGTQMIAWGGLHYPSPFLNTGGVYCAQPSSQLQNVVSRKTHGFSGDFDVNLPLNGPPAIECRSGGATNDYTIVLTFNANVSVTGNPQAAVTSGVGTIGSGGVSNGGRVIVTGNLVTIPLTNVANAQTIQVTLYGVNGSTNFVIPMSILVGDTNGNGSVNASDVSQAKSRVGQQINATNFRSDVNANGYIDAADVAFIKSSVGTGLP